MLRIGIDIGSTTVKIVALDGNESIVFKRYRRHEAKPRETVAQMLGDLIKEQGDTDTKVSITGSVGMGIAESTGIEFVQEVVAASKAIKADFPATKTMIDIGGEDAKVVFFRDGEATELRMNGNCAGGTGAFIDQMAVILGVSVDKLDSLALKATQVHPIASRCGVFCKTDIQNLVAKNVCQEDIAASIFHAVAVQTVTTLSHGQNITSPVLMCGGPLTFIPALRKAFADYLHLQDSDIILPTDGALLPATGAAIASTSEKETIKLSALIDIVSRQPSDRYKGIMPIFTNGKEYEDWKKRISSSTVKQTKLTAGHHKAFLGIDSGSTTTKIVLIDDTGQMLFSYYQPNGGHPIETVEQGLSLLDEQCKQANATIDIIGSCSTGYGEDLIKAAFQLGNGIVETIAHYMAAVNIDNDVTFILDIGGQDMKAIFIDGGVIDRIEINEACSSGCGTFIETFAMSLGYTAAQFAELACQAKEPCDLGTRCTVFMNSKVKQALREGASVADIAAGLAYSVVKNCIYKVLKLTDVSQLGSHIVVQGGTMLNNAVVRALEKLTGATVSRSNVPQLMGAYGCALYAMKHQHAAIPLSLMLEKASYTKRQLHCHGCDNQCLVTRYRFDSGKDFFAGNRCERVFSNGEGKKTGANAYIYKRDLLFSRTKKTVEHPRMTIGIPRCLNMYENFPFWHTLLTECNIAVCLSDESKFSDYERSARMVMSDNICFPAKVVHSHIQNLFDHNVDRIFMPFVVFEKKSAGQNSYNCPIVTGYGEVIKSVQGDKVPIDSPAISFKNRTVLYRQCLQYLSSLGVKEPVVARAFLKAEQEQEQFAHRMAEHCHEILNKAKQSGHLAVMLAGRPYHTDALIQHDVSDVIASMGIDVLTDDIARFDNSFPDDVYFLSQWAYPGRILNAAKWCINAGEGVEFVQLTSFGCGPDAFLTDETRSLLLRHGKAFTLLKLDDINNVGSMRLRVRSLVESLKLTVERKMQHAAAAEFTTTPVFDKQYRHRKIIAPYFTPFISPLIPALMHVAGYEAETLPPSDAQSCELGLKYANNEVCYPATLIVGDIMKAFASGQYKPDEVVVAMTQTGGQCRASNYIYLIKKALISAGYKDTPVMSLAMSSGLHNVQSAFKVNWVKMLPIVLRTVIYSDCIAKLYYPTVAREKEYGLADKLRTKWLDHAAMLIRTGHSERLIESLSTAVNDFSQACSDTECPRVGIVGEIFLKFNPFANRDVAGWLSHKGIEVVPSMLTDFFMQTFVNTKVWNYSGIQKTKRGMALIYQLCYKIINHQIKKADKACAAFRHYTPFNNIFDEADEAKQVINLNAQFGEGWLLPAEIISYVRRGVNNVISLQPFGCIANHIVSRGIENRIKRLFPQINLLSLDFDSGVSDVNVTNRLLLFLDKVKNNETYRLKCV